ncbi:hypothetical protein TNIN_281471 [Trichonephila inaurata madagascariensis]|uniref:Uncharacterized protein n=1 Tax=Trichonephila inaurata madagascariensis TaxID=2747483 RepID=A0A8X6X4B3_9ARAC|nr:hypothetical protein TNIN_281471 [Trichonephila inaurata madagascariensis]
MEASSDRDVVNRRTFYSSPAKEQENHCEQSGVVETPADCLFVLKQENHWEQSGVVETPADCFICPERREKLKDKDEVMKHDCTEKNVKSLEQSGVVETPADCFICPERREKLKDKDEVMKHDCTEKNV